MVKFDAKTILLIAVIVVIALILIYIIAQNPEWAQKSYLMARFVETPEKVYRRSNGTFDDAAQMAIQRVIDRHYPTFDDHALAATIITRNVTAQEHRPEMQNGHFAPQAIERANLRQEMFDQARNHYIEAMHGLHNHLAAPQAALPPQAGFIIDAALEFAVGGLTILLGNDPILLGEWDGIVFDGIFDIPLAHAAQQTRAEVIARRQEVAHAQKTPSAAVDAYINLAVHHTNDPQNVHDTAVHGCMRAMINRLRVDQKDITLPSLSDIIADIQKGTFSDLRTMVYGLPRVEKRPRRLQEVIEIIEKGELNERCIMVGCTDKEALQRAWMRAEDPRNAANRDKIRQAIFDELANCWEDGITGRNIKCVTGRTEAPLGALSTLDFDNRNSDITTLEQFKNDVFAKTRELIAQEAKTASESSDAAMRNVGLSYIAKTPAELVALKIDDAVAEKFINTTKEAIARLVDAEVADANVKTDNAISAQMAEGVKMECIAAVC